MTRSAPRVTLTDAAPASSADSVAAGRAWNSISMWSVHPLVCVHCITTWASLARRLRGRLRSELYMSRHTCVAHPATFTDPATQAAAHVQPPRAATTFASPSSPAPPVRIVALVKRSNGTEVLFSTFAEHGSTLWHPHVASSTPAFNRTRPLACHTRRPFIHSPSAPQDRGG